MLSAMHSSPSLNMHPSILQAPTPALHSLAEACCELRQNVSHPALSPSPTVMARAWQDLLLL